MNWGEFKIKYCFQLGLLGCVWTEVLAGVWENVCHILQGTREGAEPLSQSQGAPTWEVQGHPCAGGRGRGELSSQIWLLLIHGGRKADGHHQEAPEPKSLFQGRCRPKAEGTNAGQAEKEISLKTLL